MPRAALLKAGRVRSDLRWSDLWLFICCNSDVIASVVGASAVQLPYNIEQFYSVFVQYNDAIWPMQIVLYVIGFGTVLLMLRARAMESRIISGVLALLWGWAAVTYCFMFFTAISRSGWVIGSVILAGGLWMAWVGSVKNEIRFQVRGDLRDLVGGLLITYALIAYPLIGYLVGHRFPAMPTFGVPCPVTIFTVGMLMLTASVPRSVFVAPAVWGLFGGSSATFQLGVFQDAGLLIAGVIALVAVVFPSKATRPTEPVADGAH
jgi:hypothetical protein